ncbi:hypothetical protein [Thermococcus sp.]
MDMEYLKRAKQFLAENGNVEKLKREIMELSSKQAAFNYKLYDTYITNRTLAIRIYGYLSENLLMGGDELPEDAKEIVDKYLMTGRKKHEH